MIVNKGFTITFTILITTRQLDVMINYAGQIDGAVSSTWAHFMPPTTNRKCALPATGVWFALKLSQYNK